MIQRKVLQTQRHKQVQRIQRPDPLQKIQRHQPVQMKVKTVLQRKRQKKMNIQRLRLKKRQHISGTTG